MAEEIMYECLRCGKKAPGKEWMRTGDIGAFKCPVCSFKISKKIRPPIAKRVKTT